jgi:hypothetical protein
MKTKSHIYFVLIVLFAISACKKDKPSAPISKSDVDIYVAGVSITANGIGVATYWKNGVPVKLTDSSGYSEAKAIIIKGSDVYVAGFIGDNKGVSTAVYWKNGIITKLTDGLSSAKAYGIALQGNNVYVVGAKFIDPTPQNPVITPIATYWKNNVATRLPDKLKYVSEFPGCITLNGDDVYISGNHISIPDGKDVISYWKNGVTTVATDSTSNAFASAMALSGTDIYFAGNSRSDTYRFGQAAYWKNGKKTDLLFDSPNSTIISQANAIAIVGNDVYTVGSSLGIGGILTAIYWKNDVGTALSAPGSSSSGSAGSAIVVSGKDIYIAGTGSRGGVYWKNGAANYLTGALHAYDIKIIPHQ